MGSPPFFFMYRCLFEVLGLILPLIVFQCALLEHLNVAPSQLHPNSWAMVRAFEILCPFFNIRPSVSVFLFFFQMKLTTKIGWVSRKLFEFDANVFRCFKDCFFKVLATDVVADGLPQMFNRNEEPCFPFYWQSDPTRFKLFGEDLLTLVEMIDNAILEQLWVSLDPRAILSLPLASDPLVALDSKVPNLVFLCV